MSFYCPLAAGYQKNLQMLGLSDKEINDLCSVLYTEYIEQYSDRCYADKKVDFYNLFVTTKKKSFRKDIETNLGKHFDALRDIIKQRLHSASIRQIERTNSVDELEITRISLLRLFINQKGKCFYNPMITLSFMSTHNKNHVLSIERLDQKIGYTHSNTVFIAMQYQTSKQYSHALLKKLFMGHTFEQPIVNLEGGQGHSALSAVHSNSQEKNIEKRIACKQQKYQRRLEASIKHRQYRLLSSPVNNLVAENDQFIEKEPEYNIDDMSDDENEVDDVVESSNSNFPVTSSSSTSQPRAPTINWGSKAFVPTYHLCIDDIRNMYNKQRGRCYYSQHPLAINLRTPFTLSIERVVNSSHYTTENCVLVCQVMQASRVKWTKQTFIDDHHHWRNNEAEYNFRTRQTLTDHATWLSQGSPNIYKSAIYFCTAPRRAETIVPDLSTLVWYQSHFQEKMALLVAECGEDAVALSKIKEKSYCIFCEDNFGDEDGKQLTQHVQLMHPHTMIACPEDCRSNKERDMYNKEPDTCSPHLWFKDPHLFLSHYLQKHCVDREGNVTCPICGHLTSPGNIAKHMRNDHQKIGDTTQYNAVLDIFRASNVTPFFCAYSRDTTERKKVRAKRKRVPNPEQFKK